jgi:DNA polymerase elongation subunit (family B)
LAQAGGYLGLDIAGATVTYIGRTLVQAVAEEARALGYIVVYGDTDSVMLKRIVPYTEVEIKNLDKIAGELCKKINEKIPELCVKLFGKAPKRNPIRLAVDGLFKTFLAIAPKMYCFIRWDAKNPLSVNKKMWGSKGVASAKRDTCKMNRNLHKLLSQKITAMEPFEDVIETLHDEIHRLLYGKLDVVEMVTIKQLSAEYKKPNYPMSIYYRHLNALGLGVKPGDRVPYVMRLKPGAKHQGELYEDPDVFIREGYEFNRFEYLNGQFAGKIDTMLRAAYPQFIPPEFLSNMRNVHHANPKAFNLWDAMFMMISKHSASYAAVK